MSDYKNSLRYNPSHDEGDRRKITGKRTVRKSKKYRARQAMKQRIIALALAGGIAAGAIGTIVGIKSHQQEQEEKYISNMEEILRYNINAQDLQISPELYEQVMNLTSELEEADQKDFEGVSNLELAEYYSEMSDLYLNLLKGKVSTVTGMKTSEFTLVAPSAHGTEITGTAVKDPEMLHGIRVSLKSDEIDEYMLDVVDLKEYSSQIKNGDVDRSKLESKLMNYKDKLSEVATLNLLREMSGKDTTKLAAYRIETRDLEQAQETKKITEIEK